MEELEKKIKEQAEKYISDTLFNASDGLVYVVNRSFTDGFKTALKSDIYKQQIRELLFDYHVQLLQQQKSGVVLSPELEVEALEKFVNDKLK